MHRKSSGMNKERSFREFVDSKVCISDNKKNETFWASSSFLSLLFALTRRFDRAGHVCNACAGRLTLLRIFLFSCGIVSR